MKINWYPGHMKRARRQILKVLPKMDVMIEILDARLPKSSTNPILEGLRPAKPCIKILNKNDLADPAVTRDWVRFFEERDGVRALPLNAKQRLEVDQLPRLCRTLAPHRSAPGQTLRAMVVGIPNVGKSTLINTLIGRRIARAANKPAITTCPQQIDLRNGILLFDTPGLLWPALDDQTGAFRLAASGAIGRNALDEVSVALFAVEFMAQRYPKPVMNRYKWDRMPEEGAADLLEEIGRRRGCLTRGGEIDLQRAAEIFLRELQSGKLGRVSFEEPEI